MHNAFHSHSFLVSFLCTMLVLLLLIGLVVVDTQGRRISFNDTSPAVEILYTENGTAQLQINAFSLDQKINITAFVKLWHFIADFFCIPHKNLQQP